METTQSVEADCWAITTSGRGAESLQPGTTADAMAPFKPSPQVTAIRAAAIDGAGPVARFVFITLPQMRPAILVAAILVTIQTLNTFDVILALTGGGPGRATEVLSLFTFNTVFYNFDLSGGSVLALILVAIAMLLTFVYVMALVGRGGDR